MSRLFNFFRRARPGQALSQLPLVENLNRVANVLEDIKGEGCHIEKPLDQDGLGWKIIYDGGVSDLDACTLPDTSNKRLFMPFHAFRDGARWCVHSGPVYLNGDLVTWDSSQYPAYQDFNPGDSVFLVIYEELREGWRPEGVSPTDPHKLKCGFVPGPVPVSPATGGSPKYSHLIASFSDDAASQFFEGPLYVYDYNGDDGNSITFDAGMDKFSFVSNGEMTVDLEGKTQDVVVRGFDHGAGTVIHSYYPVAALVATVAEYEHDKIIKNLLNGIEGFPTTELERLVRQWFLDNDKGSPHPSSSEVMPGNAHPRGTLLVGTVGGGYSFAEGWKTVGAAIQDGSIPAATAAAATGVAERVKEVRAQIEAVESRLAILKDAIEHYEADGKAFDSMNEESAANVALFRVQIIDAEAALNRAEATLTASEKRLAKINERIDALEQK